MACNRSLFLIPPLYYIHMIWPDLIQLDINVKISILDVNDNPPVFQGAPYTATMNEVCVGLGNCHLSFNCLLYEASINRS